MKKLYIAAMLCLSATGAYAGSCKSDAADKHLAGSALTSFMKKCQADASTTCAASSDAKKLVGAAKTSFVKKCMSDAVGM